MKSWRIMSTWLPMCCACVCVFVNEMTVLDASLDYNLLTPHQVCICPHHPMLSLHLSITTTTAATTTTMTSIPNSIPMHLVINLKYLHVTSMVSIVVPDSPQ